MAFTLAGPYFKFECETARLAASTTAESGNPLSANGEVVAESCAWGPNNEDPAEYQCANTDPSFPPATFAATSGGDGVITFGSSEKHASFSFSCSTGAIKCTYGTASLPLTLDWSEDIVSGSGITLTRESGTSWQCAETATLTIELEAVDTPNKNYAISLKDETVLCKTNKVPCAPADILPSGTALGGWGAPIGGSEVAFTLATTGIAKFECETARLAGSTTAESGNPLSANGEAVAESCAWGVNNEEPAIYSCANTDPSFPPATFAATSGGDGVITFGSSEKHASFSFSCNTGAIKCTYGTSSLPLTLDWSEDIVSGSGITLTKESGTSWQCGTTATLTIELEAVDTPNKNYAISKR